MFDRSFPSICLSMEFVLIDTTTLCPENYQRNLQWTVVADCYQRCEFRAVNLRSTKVELNLSVCFFNWAPRHEGVLGSGGTAARIIDLGSRWRWPVGFTPRPLYHWGKSPRYPLDKKLIGPQSLSGRSGEVKKKSHHCSCRELNSDRPARNIDSVRTASNPLYFDTFTLISSSGALMWRQ